MVPYEYAIASSNGWDGSPEDLRSPQPGEKVATTGAATVVLDLGAARPVRQLFAGYTDAQAGDTIRLRGSNSPAMAGILFDSGVGPLWASERASSAPLGYRHGLVHILEAAVAARYWEISLGVPAGREVGIIAIGDVAQPENNADYGETSWGFDEADEGEFLDSGVEVLYEATPAPVFNFTLSWTSQDEMELDWEPLGRLQHEGRPVLSCRRPDPHPGRHSGLYWGRLRMIPIVAQDFDMYEVQGRVRSMV